MSQLRFSQRIGVTPVKSSIQIDSMDKDLRNSIWNVLRLSAFDLGFYRLDEIQSCIQQFFFKLPLDDIQYQTKWQIIEQFKNRFFAMKWHEVYDFIEFVVAHVEEYPLVDFFNDVFERENSAYKFVDGVLSPIVSHEEIVEIELAANDDVFSGAGSHIKTALAMLSDRKNPDYRNSITESISAVESVARVISGKPNATLGVALSSLPPNIDLHPSLVEGFKKIYGYTCDEKGLRHSFVEERSVFTQADAMYFLVSCSAFINYLKSLSSTLRT